MIADRNLSSSIAVQGICLVRPLGFALHPPVSAHKVQPTAEALAAQSPQEGQIS
ncbi:MAG: hypothetical protein RLZZ468_1755 [Cyanobacteriota bacterium]|jgi:hypothetical protein